MASIDDFKKLDIRIGKIISAERVPETEKLLRLMFDLGSEKRHVIAGIASAISDPKELLGVEMPVIVNLESRMIRGLESQGMILCASDGEKPVLLHPAYEVPPGSMLR